MKRAYELDVYKLAEELSDMVWQDFDRWNKKVQTRLPTPGTGGQDTLIICPEFGVHYRQKMHGWSPHVHMGNLSWATLPSCGLPSSLMIHRRTTLFTQMGRVVAFWILHRKNISARSKRSLRRQRQAMYILSICFIDDRPIIDAPINKLIDWLVRHDGRPVARNLSVQLYLQ